MTDFMIGDLWQDFLELFGFKLKTTDLLFIINIYINNIKKKPIKINFFYYFFMILIFINIFCTF